jgi:hypothetical protein
MGAGHFFFLVVIVSPRLSQTDTFGDFFAVRFFWGAVRIVSGREEFVGPEGVLGDRLVVSEAGP